MPFTVPQAKAEREFPEFTFITPLTPSEQKAAFHVQDKQGRDLCLKIISPNYDVDRINREIHALQSISHPNVVRLEEYTYTSTPAGLRHYMVEEFVEGEDLADRLVAGHAWPAADACLLFAQLADGLEALRAVNVVHRDLKPQNIRVRPSGSPIIIDFGVARHLTLPDLTLTAHGAGFGTPAYFAPEQFRGTKREIDHRTDLFAFGIMFYQALTGTHPFVVPGMSLADLQDAVCAHADYARDTTFLALPNRLRLLVNRLMEKDRIRRPNDPARVAAALRDKEIMS
jgi:serine/threonine protein kinase